jgi:hypothetical protein
MNKVVARFIDGRMVKGMTSDFVPGKDRFHVMPGEPGSRPVPIETKELKALFFVKDLAGNPKHVERKEFETGKAIAGKRIRVVFTDGEVMIGSTNGYQGGRPGFFFVPADSSSNILRCYVVVAATAEVTLL